MDKVYNILLLTVETFMCTRGDGHSLMLKVTDPAAIFDELDVRSRSWMFITGSFTLHKTETQLH